MIQNEITLEDIISTDNLYQAWRKLEKSISYTDVWYDETAFLAFKFRLDQNIEELRADVIGRTYRTAPIRPIPFPKGLSEEQEPRVRLAYSIAMRDQLLWVAVCNLLGPITEKQMPGWSFGNRLFVPMWREKSDMNGNKGKWRCGNFMNSYPFIYKKWKQSWPRFRKVLSASLKYMAIGRSLEGGKNKDKEAEDILDENDEEQIAVNRTMPHWVNVPFLNMGYFEGGKYKHKLFWSSIDIEKFYPTIDLIRLKNTLISICGLSQDINQLIDALLEFDVDVNGYSQDELSQLGFEKDRIGLPTGLIVGGWLANVYFLPIDTVVRDVLKTNHNIIHLRYVDDHTFVSDSPETLIRWMSWYVGELNKIELHINPTKLVPKQNEDEAKLLTDLLDNGWRDLTEYEEVKLSHIYNSMTIDPRFPSPLMTQTLQKVSQLSSLELRFLNPDESERVFFDLQSLVTVDLPDEEIKKETRISFASTMLSRMMVDETPNWHEINKAKHRYIDSIDGLLKNMSIDDARRDQCVCLRNLIFERFPLKYNERSTNQEQLAEINWTALRFINDEIYKSRANTEKKAKKVYHLLIKALHESPEKVNIWLRTLEMCFRHLPNKIADLFSELKRMSTENKIHELSRIFLERQMTAMCASRLIMEAWRLYVQKHDCTSDSVNEKLIDSLSKIKNVESSFFFIEGTNNLLCVAKSFLDLVISGAEFKSSKLDKSFEGYWILSAFPNYRGLEYLHDLICFFTDFITDDSPYRVQLSYKIAEICEKSGHEVPQRAKDIIEPYSHILTCGSRNCPSKGFVSLIDIIKSASWRESWVYSSEWFSCKVVSTVIDEIANSELTQSVMKGLLPITLKNIYLKSQDWKHLKVEDNLNAPITLKIGVLDTSDEFAQSCMIKKDASYLGEAPVVFQLGVMLYYLVSGEIPSDRKEISKINSYHWSNKIRHLENSGKVSTVMKNILSGCLLPFSFEQKRVGTDINPSLKKIQIMRIMDLYSKLRDAEEALKNRIVPKHGIIPNSDEPTDYLELKVIEIE